MGRFGLCGPTYTSQSPNADDERCVNWYPETIEGPGGKSAIALYPRPGLQNVVNITGVSGPLAGGVRGLIAVNGINTTGTLGAGNSRIFSVIDTRLTEIILTLTPPFSGFTTWGTPVPNDGLPVSMAVGPTQLIFASGGSVFVFNLGTSAFTAVAAANFNNLPISQVGYCDGFFLALNANSNQWYASAPLDATTWPGASTNQVTVFPGNVVSMIVNQRQVWMLGAENSVVYYDSGNSPFPFDVVSGSLMEQGCIALNSSVKLDNSIFWLGGDSRGQAMVWRASGYTPRRVSNHSVEFFIQGYAEASSGFRSTVSDCRAYGYQTQGHSFLVMYFPSANLGRGATWVYDVATDMWHEWNFLNPDGSFSAHRSQNHCFAQGTSQHLVGDWKDGNVLQMAIPVVAPIAAPNLSNTVWQFADDFGNPIERLRRSPHINFEKEWVFHHKLEIDLETGLGPIPPLTTGTQFQTFEDSFNRTNQNPITAPWTNILGTTAQIQNDLFIGGTGNAHGQAVYNNTLSWPHDQKVQARLITLNSGKGFAGFFLNFSGAHYYQTGIDVGFTPGGFGIASSWLFFRDGVNQGQAISLIPQQFDIFTAIMAGQVITILQNGKIIGSYTDPGTTLTAGTPGLDASPYNGGVVTDIAWDSFEASGSFAGSFAIDPQVMLRWSDDSGHTWKNQFLIPAGQAGQYGKRVIQRRLGRSRNRVYEMSCSDPIPWRVVDAYLKASPDYTPKQRLLREVAKSA